MINIATQEDIATVVQMLQQLDQAVSQLQQDVLALKQGQGIRGVAPQPQYQQPMRQQVQQPMPPQQMPQPKGRFGMPPKQKIPPRGDIDIDEPDFGDGQPEPNPDMDDGILPEDSDMPHEPPRGRRPTGSY